MEDKLTESEMNFLEKLIKNSEKLYLNYIATGLLFCLCILGTILGVQFDSKSGFLMAIYFGTIAIILLLKTRFDLRVVNIIRKLLDNNDKF